MRGREDPSRGPRGLPEGVGGEVGGETLLGGGGQHWGLCAASNSTIVYHTTAVTVYVRK